MPEMAACPSLLDPSQRKNPALSWGFASASPDLTLITGRFSNSELRLYVVTGTFQSISRQLTHVRMVSEGKYEIAVFTDKLQAHTFYGYVSSLEAQKNVPKPRRRLTRYILPSTRKQSRAPRAATVDQYLVEQSNLREQFESTLERLTTAITSLNGRISELVREIKMKRTHLVKLREIADAALSAGNKTLVPSVRVRDMAERTQAERVAQLERLKNQLATLETQAEEYSKRIKNMARVKQSVKSAPRCAQCPECGAPLMVKRLKNHLQRVHGIVAN